MGRPDRNIGEIDDDLFSKLNDLSNDMKAEEERRSRVDADSGLDRPDLGERRNRRSQGEEGFSAFDDAPNISSDLDPDFGMDLDIEIEEDEPPSRRRSRVDFDEPKPRRRTASQEDFEEPRPDRSIDWEDDTDIPNDFSDEDTGPISLDQPQKSGRRRPMMDEDDEEFVPRKRSKKAGGSILDKIHLQPKYVAIIVAVIAFFAIGAFLDSGSKDSEGEDSIELKNTETIVSDVSGDTSETEEQEPLEGSSQVLGGTTVERGELLNDTSVSFSKEVYDDTIAVSKFLEFRGASCIPKFMGYSDVLQREIEFQVSAEDYNKYLNGVKINITYRALEKDGITYVTDIKIKK